MEKHLVEELKKLTSKEDNSARTSGEALLAAILLDILDRENEENGKKRLPEDKR